MPFRRLFGRRSEPPPKPEPDPDDSGEDPSDELADEDASAVEDDGLEPEHDSDAEATERSWRQRAIDVIPGGTSTGSKRATAIYGAGATSPTHYVRAAGCHLVTAGERSLIDCTMALGAVALGYGDDGVARAVLTAVANGNVAGLAHQSEVEIAERLCEVIPCAEAVRFLKSGAEAVSAAVRIARTATSRSQVVVSGYFGWHDWASEAAGVPDAARHDVTRVPFDDIAALESACREAGSDLAAIVLEPVVERLPSVEWIAAARRLATDGGAVLVFDELKTGFRLRPGGFQELSGVLPDLATFGKAMANGFPIAAVVGRHAIMDAAEQTWISSTLAGESVALAAVSAVLDRFEEESELCDTLERVGRQMRESVAAAAEASGVGGVRVSGLDAMWQIHFDDETTQRRFLERAVAHGVLFKRGAYNFAALAHDDDEVLIAIEHAASSAFVDVVEEKSA